jgi:hypothetical protein
MDGGAVYSLNGGNYNGIAPWQHNFLTWSAGHAADLGFAGAKEFRNWLAKFEIGLMTDWQANPAEGYCWLEASAYSVQVKDTLRNWLPTYTAIYAATFPTLTGLQCNSPAMVAEVGRLKKKSWRAGEMAGYPYSATGFPANFQIGVAAAADSALPKAEDAWNLFDSRSVKPLGNEAYNNYPNFAVLPRFLRATTTLPVPAPPPATHPLASSPLATQPPPGNATAADPAPSRKSVAPASVKTQGT